MRQLALNKETLRELTEEDLAKAEGGADTTGCTGTTETPACPSGATWFWDCQSVQVPCG